MTAFDFDLLEHQRAESYARAVLADAGPYPSMDGETPPLTPIRSYMSPIDTSPTNSYREHLRRRTSSFSSNHSRSPLTPRKHRFSDASHLSHDGDGGEGMVKTGNLADELDQLDDDMEEDEEAMEGAATGHREGDNDTRDSGIDVTYSSKKNSPHVPNFSKPFGGVAERADEGGKQDELSPELDEMMNSVARMASYASTSEDPLIPRTIASLQDLGNQSSLEASTQRFITSTNSISAHLVAQSKSFQNVSTALFSPFFSYTSWLDPQAIEEIIPLVDELLQSLPFPDPAPLQGMQKLERETSNMLQTLSHLTDTLQMGKQITSTAARHLRTTQTMVAELRRERERGELARHELMKNNAEESLKRRRYAGECRDVQDGFEMECERLRAGLLVEGGLIAA